ncbi:MAG: hypothetical protein PUD58_05410 [Prevotella sp.]|uniref:hypothetical protein n=1 Tax=Prevotella sp. TaxID=59823 RepID=UPI0025839E33|nr:hypothetical protein [Prevotella sp.]MDD6853729.1 hypothetical protein [Prevotella sp.]
MINFDFLEGVYLSDEEMVVVNGGASLGLSSGNGCGSGCDGGGGNHCGKDCRPPFSTPHPHD